MVSKSESLGLLQKKIIHAILKVNAKLVSWIRLRENQIGGDVQQIVLEAQTCLMELVGAPAFLFLIIVQKI